MKRFIATLLTLAVIVLALFILAAGYEVTSLKSNLTRMVKHFQGATTFSLPSPAKEAAKPAENENKGSGEVKYRNVSFSVTEENLNRMLSRRRVGLHGALVWTREVSSQLSDGNISLNTVNTLRLSGIKAVEYSGFSDWSVGVLEEGVGVKLNRLEVVGVPFPYSSWLFSRLSRKTRDGWVYLRIPSRQVVEKVEVQDGKLMVSGKIQE